jgi:twitching motility protein PilJ
MKINWKLMFNWKMFGHQTIRQRLVVLFFVLVGGFALVAAAYWGVVGIDRAADTTNTRVSEFGVYVDRVQIGVLQARREEKDFFARPNDEYLQKHDKTLASVYRDIDKAKAVAPDDEAANLVGEIRTQVRTYQGTFRGAVEAQRRAGYADTAGLQGALNNALNEVEALLEKYQKNDLVASLLRMRGYQKDMIQRNDPKFVDRMEAEQLRFSSLLARSDVPSPVKAVVSEKLRLYHGTFLAMTDSLRDLADETAAFNEVVQQVEPIAVALDEKKNKLLAENRDTQSQTTSVITWAFSGALLFITMTVSLLVYITSRSITNPLSKLTGTVAAITAGNREARAKLASGDEMQQLGDAIDRMMDERGRFMQTEAENERLNNSVIALLRSVSQLGKGDLTVRVPVHEDITGALGDAINHMSENMGKTLGKVSKASEQVVETSRQTRDLTAQSRETVLGTARGMNEIRATIQETAKRIKRLGERSQEIGGIVKLIDTIAERTNMLALNANMQAAQAGEAGRGFMVVAAEVQRLAESAKEATHQISKLVSSIQVETGDTIAAMDEAIGEVVEGSELAEQAATQINRNQEMVTTLDALGRQLLDTVRAFSVPAEYVASPEPASKSIRAVA